MTKLAAFVVASALVSAVVLWSKLPVVHGLPSTQTISVQALSAAAHPDGLPIQHFEDQSLIYPAVASE